MSNSQEGGLLAEPPRRKRGRPPGSRKKVMAEMLNMQIRHEMLEDGKMDEKEETKRREEQKVVGGETEAEQEERLAYALEEKHLTLFSSVLRKLVRRERADIIRVARDLEVSENTVYRWMNGSSEPRTMHLRRLLEIFPEQRESLMQAISQTF